MRQLFDSVGAAIFMLTTLIFAITTVGALFADLSIAVPAWLFVAMFFEGLAITIFGIPIEVEEAA